MHVCRRSINRAKLAQLMVKKHMQVFFKDASL